MESPPSSSTWSEAFILSDDSGLLLTNGSATSSSVSGDSRNGGRRIPFEVSRLWYFFNTDCFLRQVVLNFLDLLLLILDQFFTSNTVSN